MSGFARTIERTVQRARNPTCTAAHYLGRGSKLGVNNPKDKALIARRARDKKWGRP